MQSAIGEPIDPAILQAFLERLNRDGQELLAEAVDLASPRYRDFCTKDLPRLMDSLSSETSSLEAVVGPAMRGAVRWGPTIVGRRSARLMSTQFVTRLPVRSAALPENVTLAWLLSSLAIGIGAIEKRLGSGSLPFGMLSVRGMCTAALVDERLVGLADGVRIPDHQTLAAAARHRLPSYRSAGVLARRRAARFGDGRNGRLLRTLDLLAAEWLEPVEEDDLFELYSLAFTLDVLQDELGLGVPLEFGLAIGGRSHVALFKAADDSAVRVFFDQSPVTVLHVPSAYLKVLATHDGQVGSARRSDIIVVREDGADRRVVLVEAKKTGDRRYGSDSVYKALGYIQDFHQMWSDPPQGPKVVLLFPEDVAPSQGIDLAGLDVVLVKAFDRKVLADSLGASLGLTVAPKPTSTTARNEHH